MKYREVGRTHDDLAVRPEYGLRLRWTFLVWERQEYFGFGVGLEFNRNEQGRRRPYFMLQVGRLFLQSGWLFG